MASAVNMKSCIVIQILPIFVILLASNGCHCIRYPYESITEIISEYHLPDLPFDYGDLEPYIDLITVRLHHLGHHAGYTRKLNAALEQWKSEAPDSYVASSILTLLEHLDDIPEKYRRGIRNNGGGFVNHNLYWSTMAANKENDTAHPSGHLLNEINKSFGSFEEFRRDFTDKALALFGSGYVWLSQHKTSTMDQRSEEEGDAHSLVITTTANQDTPISEGLQPILVLDVWEHAYYLKHQYRRANHVADWWKVTEWSAVAELSEWWTKKDEVHDEL